MKAKQILLTLFTLASMTILCVGNNTYAESCPSTAICRSSDPTIVDITPTLQGFINFCPMPLSNAVLQYAVVEMSNSGGGDSNQRFAHILEIPQWLIDLVADYFSQASESSGTGDGGDDDGGDDGGGTGDGGDDDGGTGDGGDDDGGDDDGGTGDGGDDDVE